MRNLDRVILKVQKDVTNILFKIYIQNALENWQKKYAKMGLGIQDTTIYSNLFADDELLIAQDYVDLEYMTRKLIDEYELWGSKLNVKKLGILP